MTDRPKRYFWTTSEVAIIKEHYPSGGAAACAALLPNRTVKAIQQQARMQRINYGDNTPRPRHTWTTTEQIARAITEAYRRAPDKGGLKLLAARLSRPYWWVKNRAMVLGLASPALTGNREPEWSTAEVALLEKHACKVPAVIARIFRANGYHRSATAIVVKRQRLGCDTVDVEHYTACRLADEFGVDVHVVTRWIDRGWLRAERRGTDRVPEQGGDHWRIKRRHVRDFVADSVAIIDLRKVNKVWLVDLLVNP
jgi:hypothetical protein